MKHTWYLLIVHHHELDADHFRYQTRLCVWGGGILRLECGSHSRLIKIALWRLLYFASVIPPRRRILNGEVLTCRTVHAFIRVLPPLLRPCQVDIREHYCKDTGEFAPSFKGITLNPSQWQALRDAAETVDGALHEIK